MPRHLHLPYHQSAAHETITQTHRLQLLRDLVDPAKSFFQRDRAVALLLALFAQPLTRIAALTMNDADLSLPFNLPGFVDVTQVDHEGSPCVIMVLAKDP
ncbi:hypothetical protein AB0I88_37275, partial [Actinoplanes sp. NPDC049802]